MEWSEEIRFDEVLNKGVDNELEKCRVKEKQKYGSEVGWNVVKLIQDENKRGVEDEQYGSDLISSDVSKDTVSVPWCIDSVLCSDQTYAYHLN